MATQADEQQVHLYLDQKNDPPARHDYTYTSKGFTEQTIVPDFPLRGVPVLLHIHRRKWLEEPTEQIALLRSLNEPTAERNSALSAPLF